MNHSARTLFRTFTAQLRNGASSIGRLFKPGFSMASILVAILAGSAFQSQAASVTLGWNASPDSSVTGYKVYYGTSAAALTSVYQAGNALSATIPGLLTGQTYYFGVCAYNVVGLESLVSTTTTYTCSSTAPSISLVSPVDGAGSVAPASFSFAADVVPNGHAINKVQFLSNGTVIGEDTAAPYTLAWSGVAAGSYSVSARLVYDGSYTLSTAEAIVTVTAPTLNPAIALSVSQGLAAYSAPASIPLSASVTPNGHVITKVQFLSGSTVIAETATSPYTTTWSGVGAGSYSVVARLVYDGSLSLDSAPVSVSVSGATPTIAITSPTSGASATAPGKVTVKADVAANGQTISKVQFFANGTLIGESSTAPYSVAWSSIAAGSWNLQATALYGQGSSVSSTPVTLNVGTLAAPWASSDIGSVTAKGAALIDGPTYSIQGAGIINSSSDSFRFTYQPLTGDGQIIARIDSMVIGSSGGGSVGIMIRETLTAGSRHAFMGVSSSGLYRWEKRTSSNGSTSVNHYGSAPGAGSWIKLVRTGKNVYGYTSKDGVTWTQVASTSITMASNAYIGFAVASGSTSTTTPVTFSSSQVVP